MRHVAAYESIVHSHNSSLAHGLRFPIQFLFSVIHRGNKMASETGIRYSVVLLQHRCWKFFNNIHEITALMALRAFHKTYVALQQSDSFSDPVTCRFFEQHVTFKSSSVPFNLCFNLITCYIMRLLYGKGTSGVLIGS